MARKCFEVLFWEFKFNGYGTTLISKRDFVLEGLNKYLEKNSSDTSVKNYSIAVEDGDIIVCVELSKKISLNTVINILGQMYADTGYDLHIRYEEIKKRVTVGVLR